MERAPEDTWLDVQPQPFFSPDGDSFLLLAAVQEGANDHFTHIKHVTLKQQRMAVLSHGRYEVVKILEWDTSNHLVYLFFHLFNFKLTLNRIYKFKKKYMCIF